MTTSPNKTIRVFIAVNPGNTVRDELCRLQKQLARKLGGTPFKIRWVAPEAMHLTLFFLGDQPVERTEAISQTLEKTAQIFPNLGMTLSTAGCFGKHSAPRVLWVGLNAPLEFFDLQAKLAPRLADLGIELDDRPFHPHLTLGRVKAGQGMELFQTLEKEEVNPIPFKVSSIELIQSERTPQGARYTVLGSAPVAGNET